MSKIPAWCEGEDWCGVTAAANMIGKKWHPVILHRLLEGSMGFNQLKDSIPGITSKVLSESLDDLREKNLVHKETVSKSPKKVNYSLTEQGENLAPVLRELQNWAEGNLEPAEKKVS